VVKAKRHYLKEWRRFRHKTQAQVVDHLRALDDDKIPRTEASLSRVENGEQIYTERLLLAVADIYSCETWELLGRDPYKEGKLIDLVQHLPPRLEGQAVAVIEGLMVAEERAGFTPPEPPTPRLKPRKRG